MDNQLKLKGAITKLFKASANEIKSVMTAAKADIKTGQKALKDLHKTAKKHGIKVDIQFSDKTTKKGRKAKA